MAPGHLGRGLLGHPRPRPQQEELVPLPGRQLGQPVHERYAGGPPPEASAQQSRRQDDANSVGRRQVGLVQHFAKSRVAAGLHDELRVDRRHLAQPRRLLAQKPLDSPDCLLLVAVVHSYTKYINPAQNPPPRVRET